MPQLSAYVARVGDRMKGASELEGEPFTFTLLDSDVVNAFALPGGYVYVTRGLLALANDEAELAGVLGHEIGHVTARHTAQRYDRAQLGQGRSVAGQLAGLLLGGYLGGAEGARAGGELGGQAASLGAQAYVQGYSREQEFEADQLGHPLSRRRRLRSRRHGELPRDAAGRRRLPCGAWPDAVTPRRATSSATGSAPIRARPSASHARLPPSARRCPARARPTAARCSPAHGRHDLRRGSGPGRRARPELPASGPAHRVRGAAGLPAAELADGRGGLGRPGSGDGVRHGAQGCAAGDLRGYLQSGWVTNQQLQRLQAFEVAGRPAAVGFGQVALGGQPAAAMFAAVRWPDGRVFRLLYAKSGDLARAGRRRVRAEPAQPAGAVGGGGGGLAAGADEIWCRCGPATRSTASRGGWRPARTRAACSCCSTGSTGGATLTPGDQVKLIEGG